nr:uncharacterized protein LOC113811109 [Penaeus vannamei]
MTFQRTFLAILVVSTAVLCQAEDAAEKNERLTTTTTNDVIIGTELLVYGGIIVFIVLGLIGVIGLFIPKEEVATGFYAPSAYAAPAPVYHHEHEPSSYTSYSVHRSLEDADKKYQ